MAVPHRTASGWHIEQHRAGTAAAVQPPQPPLIPQPPPLPSPMLVPPPTPPTVPMVPLAVPPPGYAPMLIPPPRPPPGGCGTGRTAMRPWKICVESGLRAPVVDPANFPRDTRRSTRPSRPSGRRSRTSQERPNLGWIQDRPPHHRVALCHMGITALGPSIYATRDPALSPGPAPILNMYWLGISIDSYLYNKC